MAALVGIFIIIFVVNCLNGELIERRLVGDKVQNSNICAQCSCTGDFKTYLGLVGNEKCIGMKDSDCSFQIDGYTKDIPLLTSPAFNTTSFRVSKQNSDNLCGNGYTPFDERIMLQNRVWEEAPTEISDSISIRINLKEANIIFQKIWSGLLIKIQIGCKLSTGSNRYFPSKNCLLFKYEGSATYPLDINNIINPITTPTSVTKTTKASNPTTKTTTRKATTDKSATSVPSSPPSSTKAPPAKPNPGGSNGGMIAGVAVGIILVVVLIVLILFIFFYRKRRRNKSKSNNADAKMGSGDHIYDETTPGRNIESQYEPVIYFQNKSYGNQISMKSKGVSGKPNVPNYENADEFRKSVEIAEPGYNNIDRIGSSASQDSNGSSIFQEQDTKTLVSSKNPQYDKIWDTSGKNERKDGSNEKRNSEKSRAEAENEYMAVGDTEHDTAKPQHSNNKRSAYQYAQNGPRSGTSMPGIKTENETKHDILQNDNSGKESLNKYVQYGENIYQIPIEAKEEPKPGDAEVAKKPNL